MTGQMRCLQIEDWGGGLTRNEIPIPEVDVTDVLVEVEATSIGLTVANIINGDLGDDPAHLPRIPGHELVGRIVETGAGVTHLDTGDLVASYTYLVCGHCDACRRGDDSLCANLAGFLSVDIDGGFAKYARLPAGNAIRLPEHIDPLEATVVPDAVATPIHVARQRAAVEPGDEVMVLGAGGGVGIHLVQVAQYYGGTVTAVDRVGWKLETCAELGAVRTIDTTEESIEEAVPDDVRFDAIVDFTGSTDLLEQVQPLLAPRGRLVNLTTFPGRTFPVAPRDQVFAETEIVGSRSFSKYEMKLGGELVADGTIEPVISEEVDMDGVPDVLETIRAGELLGRGAMVI